MFEYRLTSPEQCLKMDNPFEKIEYHESIIAGFTQISLIRQEKYQIAAKSILVRQSPVIDAHQKEDHNLRHLIPSGFLYRNEFSCHCQTFAVFD